MMFPFLKIALKNLFSKPSTRNFPAENVDAMPNYRGRMSYDAEKCVNCGMCIRVCSPSAIERVVEPVEGGDKITYTFDLTSCTFCGTCADFCGTKAIKMTEDYHMVAADAKDLVVVGSKIKAKKPTGTLTVGEECVFCGLCAKNCPEGAITVDRPNKSWTLDKDKCVKCGLCVTKCPKKCLSFK